VNNEIKVDIVVTIEKTINGTFTYKVSADSWKYEHPRLDNNDPANKRLAEYPDLKTAKKMSNNFVKLFNKKIKEINMGLLPRHRVMQKFLDNRDFTTRPKVTYEVGTEVLGAY
tara:strand:- start:163 stop:501 length:339 start_codon:yes stop_codon:yes gene_type:complete